MTPIDSIILGIVEGLTEFLPVSSTGHLILASSLLAIPSTEFVKTFEIAIQCGAIAAVALIYWKSFFDIEVLKRIAAAFIPTGIIGLALHGVVKTYLLGNVTVVLGSLLVGGIALIVFELMLKKRVQPEAPDVATDIKSITYTQAVIIGVCQAVALIPGVSRSAATIVGGLALGIKRVTIVEFSFLLAVPVMIAATGLDLVKSNLAFSGTDLINLGIGLLVSFVVALFSIRFLLKYVRTHTFIPFGIYRIAVAMLFFFFFVLVV